MSSTPDDFDPYGRPAARPAEPAGFDPYGRPAGSVRSVDERRQLLAQQVRSMVTQGGRVESQNDFDAVIATGQPVNHVLHAILSFLTCGIWAVVWIVLVATGGVKRSMASVDEYGYITVQKILTR